jgi:hypothetical protein
LLCPDTTNELVIKGDSSSMIMYSYQFNINRCVPVPGLKTCADKTTIDKWIADVDVSMWAMYKVIDFDKYGEDPTYWTNTMFSASLLDVKLITDNYIYLAKHVYDNIDSWLPFSSDITGYFYSVGRQFNRRERDQELHPE